MKRGPKFQPKYDRFRSLTSGIYVVEYGSVIKVGRSRCTQERMRQLSCQAEKEGVSIGRVCAFPVDDAMRAETLCLKAIRVTTDSRTRGEYFSGIAYERAVAVVSHVLEQERGIPPAVKLERPDLFLPQLRPARAKG